MIALTAKTFLHRPLDLRAKRASRAFYDNIPAARKKMEGINAKRVS